MPFPKEIKLFTCKNIPVSITRGWFVFVGLIFLFGFIAGGIKVGLVALGSIVLTYFFVLLHEFGHSIAAQKLGYEVPSIKVMPFSGLASITGNWSKKPKHEFIITVCGPLVNVFLAVLFLGISCAFGHYAPIDLQETSSQSELAFYVVQKCMDINLALVLFNLLPVFPMDGGRLLRSALSYYFKNPRRATEKACKLAVVFAIPICIAAFIYKMPFVCIILPSIIVAGFNEKDQVFPSFKEWFSQNNRIERRNKRIAELRRRHKIFLNLTDEYLSEYQMDEAVEKIMGRVVISLNLDEKIDDSDKFELHAKCLNLIAEEHKAIEVLIKNINSGYDNSHLIAARVLIKAKTK